MNLAIRGIDGNLGKQNADTFHNDLHKGLKADYILANPPFNVSDWGGSQLTEDARWNYGVPPRGNANYAWVQHIVSKLAPSGVAGFVLANGSMSSNTSNEGKIRRNLINADIVDAIVTLPGQLFYSTQIPVCLWFLTKNKKEKGYRDRKKEILFIDARKLGSMADRTHKEFNDEDIKKITDAYHSWRGQTKAGEYEDVKGFCKSATVDEVREHEYILTPGRYVGIEDAEDDGEPFEEKMTRLTSELGEQFAKSGQLEDEIHKNLGGLGMGFENWITDQATDFCYKVIDGTHDSPKKRESGKHLITSRHLKGYQLDLENAYFINESDFERINDRSKVEQWDILISMIGTVGEIYLERNKEINYAIKNVGLFKFNGDKSKARWMYYYLKSQDAQEYIYVNQRGSTQQYLPLGSLRNFPVTYPKSKKEMLKITDILDSIDNKIRLNNQINKNLEETAQAIFKRWFVNVNATAPVIHFASNCYDKGMVEILEEVARKELCHSHEPKEPPENVKEATEEVQRQYGLLEESLSEEQLGLLKDYDEACQTLNALETGEEFIQGFVRGYRYIKQEAVDGVS